MKRRLFVLISAVIMLFSLCACAAGGTETAVSADIAPPVFSHATGTYDEGFTLTLTSRWGTTVRYTLDGSEPTVDSPAFPREGLVISNRSNEPNVLSGISADMFTKESDHTPPRVPKATVIRAAAFTANGRHSATATATYLVGLNYKNIKVVSLVLDGDSLFDYETGIYVFGKAYDEWIQNDPDAKNAESWELEGNFSQKGREWERDVLVQVFDKNGNLGIEQDMGIRVMGAASRRYYQKSFRLTAREDYGTRHFEYPLIDGLVTDTTGEPLEKYKSFVLRNGGNDNGYAFLRDPFIQGLVTDRDFATQDSEPCIVLINGEYWGLYAITEDYSDNYIQYNYDVDNENVVMVKNWEIEEGTEADAELFEEINSAIYSLDFSVSQNYDWLWTKLDMESFIDYMATTIYINNEDGIIEGNNWRVWRARETASDNEYADGRWRFMLYDTDMSMGLYSDGGDSGENTLKRALDTDWGWGLLFSKLMQVEDFRCRFVNTVMDLRNTSFEFNDATELLTLLKLKYAPYVTEQFKRNGPAWVLQWEDINSRFDSEVNVIRRYINGRHKFIPTMLAETLGLGETYTLRLSVSNAAGGTVQVNTVTPDLSGGAWEGAYFSDVPVTLTAQPAEGYVFTGWSGIDSTQKTVSLELTGSTAVTANFEQR